MTNESSGQNPSGDTDKHTLSPSPFEPTIEQRVMALEAQSRDHKNLGESENLANAVKVGEIWLIGINAALLIVNIVIACIYSGQLIQMRNATEASTNAVELARESLETSSSQFDRAQQQTITQTVASIHSSMAAKSAADIAKQALISGQRAFVSLGGFVTEKLPQGSNTQKSRWSVAAQFLNSGSSPAIDAMSKFRSERRMLEPNEEEFLSNTETRGRFSIGAHASTLSMEVIELEKDYVGIDVSEGQRGDIITPGYNFEWGWVIYRDIFPNTPVHVTEFCQTIHRFSYNESTKSGSFFFDTCSSHNCTDETCKDYKVMASKLK